ncbi:MFS transporter [Streptomyces sp. MJP52]|uniref:MFS transporter n=1 Tax=Streptomyces sp. MJP52 TaxID=2940555 RepID=UPI002475FB30|nr:MFS transporter [Streptomyces sp. MJP52]MDH6228651.1 MFS family permease [Streptomyces sp. MJP52]
MKSRQVLRHRDFRLLVTGASVSSLGNAITPVALAFAVLDLGGSLTDLGLVEAVFAICQVVTMLAGGVMGDRFSRKLMMEGSSAVSAVVMAVMASAVVLDAATIWLIAVLGGIGGVVTALSRPSSKAMTRVVVPEADLADAVALRSLVDSVCRTLGYAVAGVLVAVVGPGWAVAVDAATFAVAALAFGRMGVSNARAPRTTSPLTDLGEGFREVARHTWLWLLILQALLYHLFYGGAQAVIGPVVVGEEIGRSAWGFALSALMAGFVVGGLLALRIRPRRPLGAGVVLLALTGVFPLAMAMADTLWPVMLGAFVHGVGLQMFSVYWDQTIQSQVPEDKLARVYAFDSVGSFVARPLGLALTGPVAAAAGVDSWLLVVAAVISGSSLAVLFSRGVRALEPAEAARVG